MLDKRREIFNDDGNSSPARHATSFLHRRRKRSGFFMGAFPRGWPAVPPVAIEIFPFLGSEIMSDLVPMSREKYNQLRAEVEHLENVEMPLITEKIAEARAEGDLKENAEYHAQREN